MPETHRRRSLAGAGSAHEPARAWPPEPLGRLPELLSLRRRLVAQWSEAPPDLFLGIDAPDFNLGLARRVRKNNVATAQLVSPTVWAWRPGRIHTVARAGIDFIGERKLRVTRERLEELTRKLDRLRNKSKVPPTETQIDVLDRIEASRNRLIQQMAELTDELDMSEDATIEVFGTAYPGVTIHICRASYTVEEALSSVAFFLDKDTGRVMHRDIEK